MEHCPPPPLLILILCIWIDCDLLDMFWSIKATPFPTNPLFVFWNQNWSHCTYGYGTAQLGVFYEKRGPFSIYYAIRMHLVYGTSLFASQHCSSPHFRSTSCSWGFPRIEMVSSWSAIPRPCYDLSCAIDFEIEGEESKKLSFCVGLYRGRIKVGVVYHMQANTFAKECSAKLAVTSSP